MACPKTCEYVQHLSTLILQTIFKHIHITAKHVLNCSDYPFSGHVRTQEWLKGYSRNLILENFLTTVMCFQVLLKSEKIMDILYEYLHAFLHSPAYMFKFFLSLSTHGDATYSQKNNFTINTYKNAEVTEGQLYLKIVCVQLIKLVTPQICHWKYRMSYNGAITHFPVFK